LYEDVGPGDVTTLSIISRTHRSSAIIHAKADGVVAGLPVAAMVFAEADSSIVVKPLKQDGDPIARGDVLMEIEGSTIGILTGERLALNILQRLSAIATKTQQFVKALEGLSPAPRVVDTRKTTPGLRLMEKYAVRVGGGHSHRYGLFDAVLLKDNHIKAAGGLTQAISLARANVPHTMRIEVEVETMEQLREAVAAGADIIMYDNMTKESMAEATRYVRQQSPHIVLEASGGVRIETVRAIAETGVDIVSVGGLTHSVQALDISLDLYDKKEVQA
jgi:nicotinate-nucleotide pyrophosphorylase (carboxylating)